MRRITRYPSVAVGDTNMPNAVLYYKVKARAKELGDSKMLNI